MDQGKTLHQEEKNEIKMREKLPDASTHQTSKKNKIPANEEEKNCEKNRTKTERHRHAREKERERERERARVRESGRNIHPTRSFHPNVFVDLWRVLILHSTYLLT
jgi:hypothetical protein